MSELVITLLRLALIVILLGLVLGQVLVIVIAAQAAETFPEVEYLVIPYSVIGILVIGCGQAALLVVWRLLSMVGAGVIFTRRALRWVDGIILCGLLATILNAGVWVHLLTVHGGGPGIILWLVASSACGIVVVLLVVVLRGLLHAAIADRPQVSR